jgi:tRNA A-37 threonylcarbamoyl transferase component Bud32
MISQLLRWYNDTQALTSLNALTSGEYRTLLGRLLPDGFVVLGLLGHGTRGSVYKIGGVSPRGEYFAVKFVRWTNLIARHMFVSEVLSHVLVQNTTVNTLPLLAYGMSEFVGFIITPIVSMTALQFLRTSRTQEEIDDLVSAIMSLAIKLCSAGFAHGDMHLDNIGLEERRGGVFHVVLMDFDQVHAVTSCHEALQVDLYKLTAPEILFSISFANKEKYLRSIESAMRDVPTGDFEAALRSMPDLEGRLRFFDIHKEALPPPFKWLLRESDGL